MIHEILKDWRMKVGLQDAIGAVHGAVGSDMQDSVSAADIRFGAGTFSQKGPPVLREEEHTLPLGHGIVLKAQSLMDFGCVIDHDGSARLKPFSHPLNHRMVSDSLIDV
jgi:hypothetical protein